MNRRDTAVGYVGEIDSFALALKVEGLKPHTVSCYVREARRLGEHAGWIPPAQVTAEHVRAYIGDLASRVGPKTVHEAQLGLRRFFRFLMAEGEVDADPTASVKLTKYRVTPQPTYCEREVRSLISSCDRSTPEGIRDRAMLITLYDTGVRAGELVSMAIPDWSARQVPVDGKGGVRFVPLGDASLLAIQSYVRRWAIRDGKLWRSRKGTLTGSGVLQAVRRLCLRSGVAFKGVHAFRRAAAAQMKRLGMNDSDILEVMGWKDVTMLRRYTAAVASELAQLAHQRFSPSDALRGR